MLRPAWTKIWLTPDLAPLGVCLATALGLGVYTGIHTLAVNPSVFLDKEMRNDEMAENREWFEKRSELSSNSALRTVSKASKGRPHVFPNDYMSQPS